jgi:DNA-binding NarL/FixJ family response regulator
MSEGQRATRILLADDHTLVRRGVRMILENEPDLTVIAEAGDGAEAIVRCRADKPDLAILDIAMPRLTGLQAARELSRILPNLRILILTMYDNDQFFFEASKRARPATFSSPSPTATSSRPAERRCATNRSSIQGSSPQSYATICNRSTTGSHRRRRRSRTERKGSSS